MPIDSSIALQTQPVKIDSPLDNAGKALSLRQLMLQNAQGDQAMQDNQRLRGIYAQATPTTLSDLLWKGGFGKEGAAYDKSQLETKQANLGIKKTENELDEQKRKHASGLAAAYLSLPPEQQQAGWGQLVQQWTSAQLPGNPPPQPTEEAMRNLQIIANQGMTGDKLAERTDAASLYPAQPAQPAGQPLVKPMATAPEMVGAELPADGSEPVMPEVGVSAPPMPGEILRVQAAAMRQKGTPAAIKEAEAIERRAHEADEAEWKRRDQWQPMGGGVTFNKTTNQYMIDGKIATAAQVQRIEQAKAKAGATNIGLNTYEKELNKQDAQVVSEARTSAERAIEFADQVGLIPDVLKDYQGGPWSQVQADIGKYMPGTDFAKATTVDQIARGIQTKLAPQARAAGSGSTSDYEMKMYMESIPSLLTTAQGRDYMATIAKRIADRAAIAADIKDDLVRSGKYSVKGYRDELKKQFGDKFLTDDELNVISPKGRRAADQVMTATNPKTGEKIQSKDGGTTWQPVK